MAELGGIQFTQQDAGTTPVDRRSELGALNTALTVSKSIADKAVEGVVREDVEQEIQSELDKANAQQDSVENPTISLSDLEGQGLSKSELAFAGEIRQAQARVTQAKSSNHRISALQSVQRVQQNARSKYGWMSSEIDALTNRILSNDPNFTQLYALDSAAKASNTLSNANSDLIDNLSKYSYGTGDLQLGISAKHPVGSVQWLKDFSERDAWVQQRVRSSRELGALNESNNLDAFKKLDFTSRAVDDVSSTSNMFFTNLHQDLTELNALRTQGSDIQIAQGLTDFTARILPIHQQNAVLLKKQITDGFNNMWQGNDIKSDSYTAALVLRDRALADIDFSMGMLEAGNLDVTAYMKTQSFIRGSRAMQDLPAIKAIADLGEAGGGPEFLKTLDVVFANTAVGQRLANAVGNDVGTLLGHIQLDRFTIDGANTAEDIDRLLDQSDIDSDYNGGYEKPKDKQDEAEQAFNTLTVPQTQLQGTPSLAKNPVFMTELALDLGAGLKRSNRNRLNRPDVSVDDEVERAQEYFSSDVFMDGVLKMDRSDKNVKFFANKYRDDYWGPNGMSPRLETARSIINDATQVSPFSGGHRFIDMMVIDHSKFEATGQLTLTPNADAIKAAVAQGTVSLQDFTVARPDNIVGQFIYDTVNEKLLGTQNRFNDPEVIVAAYAEAGVLLQGELNEYLRSRAVQQYLDNPSLQTFDFNFGLLENGGSQSIASVFSPSEAKDL